jgi:WD40 repeat protein
MTGINRLVEVKGISKGSGFLIADGLILTAWHLLRPSPGVAPASIVQVWIERDIRPGEPLKNAEQPATVLWPCHEDPGDDLDFALLAIERSAAQQIRPVAWASLPDWGKVDVTAAGYPDIAIDRKRKRREPKPINGWIQSAENVRSLREGRGTLTLKMLDEDAPAAHPADAWPGMSGAAVFADDVLIGIVRIAGREGDRHQLRVLPVDRLFARGDVAEALARSGHTLPPPVNIGEPVAAQAPSWNWPRPWDFSGYISEKRQGFTARDWLFERVREWYEDTAGAQALLICADFGIGKSAFMAELASDAHGLQIAAYHFCHDDTIETLNPATFVRSVAAQLAGSLPDYNAAVEADPDARRWLDDAQLDPASAFERAVIGPLNAMSPPGAPQVMLVDALDEALDFDSEVSRRATTIVRLLGDRARRTPPWLRILATSRRRQEVLQPIGSAFKCKTLDGEDNQNLKDIRKFVLYRCTRGALTGVLKQGNKNPRYMARFLSNAKQSGGKFLYAVRVLDDLESGALSLDHLNKLPPGMDEFYRDAFERRFPASVDYAPVGALLGVLCVQREPLSQADLAAILGTTEVQVETMLLRLEDFTRSREQRYALDHPSLAQWLSQKNDKGFRRAGRYWVAPEAAKMLIADWARRELAADRAHQTGYLTRHLGAYLNPQERKVHFARLLSDFRWLDARLRAAGINALLTDWSDVDETPALRVLERALRHGAHVIGHDGSDWAGADLLASQIRGRLRPQAAPEVHDLCAQADEHLALNAGLRPLTDSLRSDEALLRTLEGHTGPIEALEVLTDGRLASGANTIRLWNPASGVCEASLEGQWLSALAVLADGRLASGSDDSTVRLWKPASGACEATFEGHTHSVSALAVLADGRLASGSHDNTIRLWNPGTGECEAVLKGHVNSVSALAVLADRRLASGSHDHTIRLWNPGTGECEAVLEGHLNAVSALAVLGDRRLASGSWDRTIRLWNPASGVCEATLRHTESIRALAVLPDGRLASGSDDHTIGLWNPASGVCEATLVGHTGWVSALAVLTDGRLASGAMDGTIKLWNLASDPCEATCERHTDVVSALAVLDDGRVASGSWDHTIRLWKPARGVCEASLEGHKDRVHALAVLANRRLASGARDGTIRLWNPTSGACEATLEHKGTLCALAVLADGRLASAGYTTIRLWNSASGACEATLEDSAFALAELADRRLASAYDKTIRLWNPTTGLCETTLKGHTDKVISLAALADGRLASGSLDFTIRLWNPASGVCEASLEGHKEAVVALAALFDGRLASGSWDKTIRVWQEGNGRWTGAVRFVADAAIETLAFGTCAGLLVAGDESGRVHFLKVEAAH